MYHEYHDMSFMQPQKVFYWIHEHYTSTYRLSTCLLYYVVLYEIMFIEQLSVIFKRELKILIWFAVYHGYTTDKSMYTKATPSPLVNALINYVNTAKTYMY